jgi:hypothetical protein
VNLYLIKTRNLELLSWERARAPGNMYGLENHANALDSFKFAPGCGGRYIDFILCGKGCFCLYYKLLLQIHIFNFSFIGLTVFCPLFCMGVTLGR